MPQKLNLRIEEFDPVIGEGNGGDLRVLSRSSGKAFTIGSLTREYLEDLYILDPELPLVSRFCDVSMDILKSVVPEDFDLDANPISLLLSGSRERNAFYTKDPELNLHYIIIPVGLFVGPNPLDTLDEYIGFLIHELGHVKRSVAGVQSNSKLEEGQGNVEAMQVLQEHGYCPEVVLAEEIRVGRELTGIIDKAGAVLDVHVSPVAGISTLEATLMSLELQWGDLNREPTSLEGHELRELARQVRYRTPVKEALDDVARESKSVGSFEELGEEDRVEAVLTLLTRERAWTLGQAGEIVRALNSEEVHIDAESLEPWIPKVFKPINALIASGKESGLLLFEELLSFCTTKGPFKVSEVLHEVPEVCELTTLIDEWKGARSDGQIIGKASEILALVGASDLFASELGRMLLKGVVPKCVDLEDFEEHQQLARESKLPGLESVVTLLYALGFRDEEVEEQYPEICLPYVYYVNEECGLPEFVRFESKVLDQAGNAIVEDRDSLFHWIVRELNSGSVEEEATDRLVAVIFGAELENITLPFDVEMLRNPDLFSRVVRAIVKKPKGAALDPDARLLVDLAELLTDGAEKYPEQCKEIVRSLLLGGDDSIEGGIVVGESLAENPIYKSVLDDKHGYFSLDERVEILARYLLCSHELDMQLAQELYPLVQRLIPELPEIDDLSPECLMLFFEDREIRKSEAKVLGLYVLFIGFGGRNYVEVGHIRVFESIPVLMYRNFLAHLDDAVPLSEDPISAVADLRYLLSLNLYDDIQPQAEAEVALILPQLIELPESVAKREAIEGLLYNLVSKFNCTYRIVGYVSDPNHRSELLQAWANCVRHEIGQDPGAPVDSEYGCKVSKIIEDLDTKVTPEVKWELLGRLADVLELQVDLGAAVSRARREISPQFYTSSSTKQVLADAGLNLAYLDPAVRKAWLELVTSEGSEESVDHFCEVFRRSVVLPNASFPDKVRTAYKWYKSVPLLAQSFLLANLLISPEERTRQAMSDALWYVLSDKLLMHAGEHREQYERMARAYLGVRSRYFQIYALGALLASYRSGTKSLEEMGEVICTFGSKVGVLSTALLQRIGYDPKTPEYLRVPARKTQFAANIPDRLTLLRWIREREIPKEHCSKLGAVLGAGKGFVTIERPGSVLQLVRENAERKIRAESELLKRAAIQYAGEGEPNSRFMDTVSVVTELALDEVSAENWERQVELQNLAFAGTVVKCGKRVYRLKVPRVLASGADWRDVEKVEGVELGRLEAGETQREASQVIVALVLRLIFQGQILSLDPSQGNFKLELGKKENTLWVLDPGQMRLREVSDEDRESIALLVSKMYSNLSEAGDVFKALDETIESFRSEEGTLPRIIADINASLISAGGHFSSIGQEDLKVALIAALKDADPNIKASLPSATRALLRLANPKMKIAT